MHAIEVFSEWLPYLHDAGITPMEMRKIYNNSKFVVVGRGQVNLDCYRIYEAIICGAIPIVCGPVDEMHKAFEYEGDVPPLLFAEDFEKALVVSRAMSNAEIDNRRQLLKDWWVNRMSATIRRIHHYISIASW